MEDTAPLYSPEKEQTTGSTTCTASPAKISLRDKLFNTTTIMIPHLESIVLDKTDKSSTYRVISKCLLEQLAVLKKRLHIIDAALERKDLSPSMSTDTSKGSGKKVVRYAETLGVPVEFLTTGIFNHREVENVLDYMETYMFYPAFKRWRTIATRTSLAKRMLVFLRKLDLVLNVCIPLAMKVPADDLLSLPKESQTWKALDEVTTEIQVFSEEKIKECWAGQNDFLFVVQAALAKTTGAVLDVKKMSETDLEEHMQVHFFDLESWREKRRIEGTKTVWQKSFVPKLSRRFWQNVFGYMLNRDAVTEDVELFIAYPSKDVIRDYWNMAETYAAKVSRRLLYGPIATRKRFYLHPDILSDHLVNTSQQPHMVSHLIDKKWRFLNKHKTAKLTIAELLPRDLYFDTNHEDRIGITLLGHCTMSIESMIDAYVVQTSQGEYLPPRKLKWELTPQATKGSSQKSESSSSPDKRNPKQARKDADNVIANQQNGPEVKLARQKAGKMGWMMGKMMGVAQMLGLRVGASTTKPASAANVNTTPQKSDMTSSCTDQEDESEGDPAQGYQNFEDESSDEGSNKARPTTKYAEDMQPDPPSPKRSPSTRSHREDRPNPVSPEKAGQSDGEFRKPSKPDQVMASTHKKMLLTAEQASVYAQSVHELSMHRHGGLDLDEIQTAVLKPQMSASSANSNTKEGQNQEREGSQGKASVGSSKSINENSQAKDVKEIFKKIIIHIHGGGFMAMSSSYHETYLRLFANELERPLFSIDYRLAPQVKFPQPLHDCIRGYLWIRQFVEEVVGTTVESVILIGDSAGGNLAFALTYWLIENNMKTPDLLVSCYSALRLETKCYTPSFFKSMEEYFLSYAGLWACCKQYLPEGADANDMYISPIFAGQEILKKMPPTRMFICLDDPLRDDQLRMASNLIQAGVDVKVKAFHHFIHGMLSLNRNECLPVRVFQDEVIGAMREHFKPKHLRSSQKIPSLVQLPSGEVSDHGNVDPDQRVRNPGSAEKNIKDDQQLPQFDDRKEEPQEQTDDHVDTPANTEGSKFTFV